MTDRLRVIIADDEPLAREAIRDVLEQRQDVEVVAECGDGDEALLLIESLSPDLVFLDIQMPGADGLAVAGALSTPGRPSIIFVTAHDEFAVRAFEVEAIDYVLKPVEDDRLNEAVDRVKRRGPGESPPSAPRVRQTLLATGRGGKVVVVRTADILYVEAADNYVRLHTSQGSLLLRQTLKALEGALDPERFVRVHRSCLVDVSRVREMKPVPSGDYEIVLDNGARLPMSRTYRDAVFEKLGGRSRPR